VDLTVLEARDDDPLVEGIAALEADEAAALQRL
jgi:hypothetical protein